MSSASLPPEDCAVTTTLIELAPPKAPKVNEVTPLAEAPDETLYVACIVSVIVRLYTKFISTKLYRVLSHRSQAVDRILYLWKSRQTHQYLIDVLFAIYSTRVRLRVSILALDSSVSLIVIVSVIMYALHIDLHH